MGKLFIVFGVVNGFIAVALGAFGAHGLEGKVSDHMLETWEKAVNYQMFHTTALLITGLLYMKAQVMSITWAGWLFLLGIVLFSGSLYVYSTTGVKTLAMITPFGGVSFLAGWIMLGYGVVKYM